MNAAAGLRRRRGTPARLQGSSSVVVVHVDWQALCAEMWADKVFVPAAARQLQEAEERGGEGLESAHVIGAGRLAAALR